MRFIALILCALFSFPASAQVAQTGAGLAKPASGGGGSPTITTGSSAAMISNGFAPGTLTFTGLNGGVNFPSGAVVVVAFGNRDGTSPTTPLIGGQTATLVTGSQDSTNKCGLYQATMPAAEPDTFSVTNGAAYSGIGAASAYFTNLSSSTRTDVNTRDFGALGATMSLIGTVTVPASGFGLTFVFSSLSATAAPTAATWTSTTSGSGDTFANENPGGYGASITLAHTATAGAGWNPTATGVTTGWDFGACMSAAAWN